ncbi:MAG: hypothetical protein J7L66_06100 [Anaerolineaceae bacterium]|nr:hypothetical protein [Anaerolineaceae bacterium]
MLQEKNAFVSLFSWLYANFIVTNSGNAGGTGAGSPARDFFRGDLSMAQYEHLPIYRESFKFLIYCETIVKDFSRSHKYTHGQPLLVNKLPRRKRTRGILNCKECRKRRGIKPSRDLKTIKGYQL